MADAPLQAGCADVEITRALGGTMPGYFTDHQSTSLLDPLKAHFLYLRKGKESRDSALRLLWQYVDEKHPWFSEKAGTILNYCHIMAWT